MKKYTGYYRNPRTTQERRANGKRSKWSRAKRSACNLPNSYDDIHICHQKTWKKKRKKQYNNRGEKHELFIPYTRPRWFWHYTCPEWTLKCYFEDNGISYRIEEVKGNRQYRSYRLLDGTERGWWYSETFGHMITWWSDKDIGIEFII